MIKKINDESINQICANLSISNIPDIIRELIDNSIDSDCSSIRIEIIESGLDRIIITDNGKGISENNFELLCKRGTTTKIETFEDVFKIKSMGFRGQALSAISCLCDLTLITKSEDNLEKIFVLCYDTNGHLITKSFLNENLFTSNRKLWTNKTGTIIIIENIFKTNELRRNVIFNKKEQILSEITENIQSYAIIKTNINFEFFSDSNNKSHLVLNTVNKKLSNSCEKLEIMKNRIENIFGRQFSDRLLEISFENEFVKFEGFISKELQSGSKYNKSKATRFYFLNERKINKIKKIDDIILNLYRQYNKDSNPIRIISMTIPEGGYDINLGESKNDVIFKNEKEILIFLEKKLKEFQEEKIKILSANNLRGTENEKNVVDTNKKISEMINFKINESDRDKSLQNSSNRNSKKRIQPNLESEDEDLNYQSERGDLKLFEKEIPKTLPKLEIIDKFDSFSSDSKINNSSKIQQNKLSLLRNFSVATHKTDQNDIARSESMVVQNFPSLISNRKIVSKLDLLQSFHKNSLGNAQTVNSSESGITNNVISINQFENNNFKETEISKSSNELIDSNDIMSLNDNENKKQINCQENSSIEEEFVLDLGSIKLTKLMSLYNSIHNDISIDEPIPKGSEETKKLQLKTIEKTQMLSMKVIGQFNKGFIIAKLENDLFIIDQHAADEKKNYESLLNNMHIVKQPTLIPIKVELLSISERHNVYENRNFFEKIGFCILKKNDSIFLSTFPTIYSYQFKYDDFLNIHKKFEEGRYKIADEMNDEEIKKLFLSDALLRYIATKACRTSIMIGTGLEKRKMISIVENLADLLSPWNCPHGRPTMRFLCNLEKRFRSKKNDGNSNFNLNTY